MQNELPQQSSVRLERLVIRRDSVRRAATWSKVVLIVMCLAAGNCWDDIVGPSAKTAVRGPFDGTYDFTLNIAGVNNVVKAYPTSRFITITNGKVSSSDGPASRSA